MRRFLILFPIVMICVAFFAKCGNSQESNSKPDDRKADTSNRENDSENISANLKKLFTKKDCGEGIKFFRKQRQEVIKKLLEIVKDPDNMKKNKAAVRASIILLGEYRAIEAITFLKEMLLFDSENTRVLKKDGRRLGFGSGLGPTAEFSIVVVALTKIGLPSIEPITEVLVSIKDNAEDGTKIAHYALCVIRDVMGPELGKIYLEDLMRKDKRAGNSKFVNNGIHLMNEAIKRK